MFYKKFVRFVLGILVFLFFAILLFFFWASSPNYGEDDYSRLIENHYPVSMDDDSVYRVVTYNIGYLSGMTNNLPVVGLRSLFDNNLKMVYDQLDSIKPDIICLQEIDYHANRSYFVNQQEELQRLGYNYVFQAINWDEKYLPFPYFPISAHFGEVLSGQSILSKYPLKDPERIVLERVADSPFYRDVFYIDRLAVVSKVILDGRTVVLINVHLEAYDGDTRTKQMDSIVRLYNKYVEDFPVLLVGDFNSDRAFERAAIQKIFALPGIGCASFDQQNSGKTFPSVNPRVRLDYIFYNTDYIEMIESKILTSFGQASDHIPVMMEFKLKKN